MQNEMTMNQEQHNPSHDTTSPDFGNRMQREGRQENWDQWTDEQRADWWEGGKGGE